MGTKSFVALYDDPPSCKVGFLVDALTKDPMTLAQDAMGYVVFPQPRSLIHVRVYEINSNSFCLLDSVYQGRLCTRVKKLVWIPGLPMLHYKVWLYVRVDRAIAPYCRVIFDGNRWADDPLPPPPLVLPDQGVAPRRTEQYLLCDRGILPPVHIPPPRIRAKDRAPKPKPLFKGWAGWLKTLGKERANGE